MQGTQLASIGARFMASLIDSILVLLAAGILAAGLSPLLNSRYSVYALAFAVMIAYYAVPTAVYGQTLGKRLMNIKVVNTQGKVPTHLQAILRELLGKIISGALLGLGYLVAVFHPEKRALHDLIGGTWVVIARSSIPTVPQESNAQS